LSDDTAQALVEFAMVLPVLLLTAMLIVTVGEIARDRVVLEHAASEGARSGSLYNDDLKIREAVAATVRPLDPAQVAVTIQPSAPPRPRGSLITVRLSYREPIALGLLGLSPIVVGGTATRMIEEDSR
jgi:Flp pilus assembly protein TadG